MSFDFILLIIAFRYLQTHEQTKSLYPEWQGFFFKGILIFAGLLSLDVFISDYGIIQWAAHICTIAVIYAAYNRVQFSPLKPFVYAFFPLVVVNIVQDLVELISPSFYKEWEELFDTAGAFAWIWLIAQFIITRKQRKTAEKEQIVAIRKEQELRHNQQLKGELEILVAKRTAELTAQKEELQRTLNELTAAQSQLIQAEKMASLGELTAGIAHEIQNPLNFVNNFSELNKELLDELQQELIKGDMEEVMLLVKDVLANEEKINHHGKRADAIVKGMLQHSRSSSGVKEDTDINELADEFLRLSYHGLRAKDKSFNARMETDYDKSIGRVKIVPQDVGRVILNLVNNAFYAVSERKKQDTSSNESAEVSEYQPTVSLTTKRSSKGVEIRVKDNGTGISEAVLEKIFQPFYTTKPAGQGTGLGLSLSFDIIKAHGGELKVESQSGVGTEFCILLPIDYKKHE